MSTQSGRPIPITRTLVAGAAVVLVLAYSLLIVGQWLLGRMVAGVIVLLERVTHPETNAATLWMPVAGVVIAVVVVYRDLRRFHRGRATEQYRAVFLFEDDTTSAADIAAIIHAVSRVYPHETVTGLQKVGREWL